MQLTLASLSGNHLALLAVAAFLPFLFSFISAVWSDSKPRGVQDFFLFERKLDTGRFATGSVGYSMQVASIYLFLYWFPLYGFWSLIVPAAWFSGYVLIGRLVKNGAFDDFLTDKPSSEPRDTDVNTIHGFVSAKLIGGQRCKTVVTVLLASTTIIAFGGTMLAEIDYALTNFVLPGLQVAIDSEAARHTLFLAVLAAAGSYIMWGGYRAAIETDTTQVRWAFALFAAIIGAFAVGAAEKGNTGWALAVCGSLLVFSVVAICWRITLRAADKNYTAQWLDYGLFVVMILIAGGSAIYASILPAPAAAQNFPVLGATSKELLGFGIMGFVSLLAANLLWQLLDVSALQRLQSLRYSSASAEDKDKVRLGMRAAGWEGTGSWVMVIAFAVVLKACGVTLSAPHEGMGSQVVLLAFFLYVVVAFMLSTLDTLVAASAYVMHYDVVPPLCKVFGKEPHITNDDEREIQRARLSTFAGLGIAAAIYIGIKMALPIVFKDPAVLAAKQAAIVYAIYAIQASIFGPVVFALFFKRRTQWYVVLLAVVLGWAAGLSSALSPTPWPWIPAFLMPADSWYVFPAFAALLASFLMTAVGSLQKSR